MNTIKRETNADFLFQRIKNNISKTNFDFNKWVFSKISIPPNCICFELCCGIGSQTQNIVRRMNGNSQIYFLDTSEKAINMTLNNIKNISNIEKFPIIGDMDEFDNYIQDTVKFHLIFCSYGLYYSKMPSYLLAKLVKKLEPGGNIVIVGPHGKNNIELFTFLQSCGIQIPQNVISSSSEFMYKIVIPTFSQIFQEIQICTAKNPVVWNNEEQFLTYWQNSTFYDASKIESVRKSLKKYFEQHKDFINTKHIMYVSGKKEK